MNSELNNFVKESLAKGIARGQIRQKLQEAGWQEEEVKSALDAFYDTDFPVPVPKRTPYLSAREAFMYLLMFLTLYISSVSFGTLLFQFVNRLLPDPLQLQYYEGMIGAIRMATASLIIAFPVFMLMSWLLARGMAKEPEKRGSKIRRWLTYITLFIAAGIIIGDLITLIRTFLDGELTLRFILKVLIILVIAGTIFGYYLWNMRKEEEKQ